MQVPLYSASFKVRLQPTARRITSCAAALLFLAFTSNAIASEDPPGASPGSTRPSAETPRAFPVWNPVKAAGYAEPVDRPHNADTGPTAAPDVPHRVITSNAPAPASQTPLRTFDAKFAFDDYGQAACETGACSVYTPVCGSNSDPCGSDYGWPCNPCWPTVCGPSWGKAEYLLWWTKGIDVPTLVTTSTAGTGVGTAGILGEANTQILQGAGNLGTGPHSGGRISFGWWLDACENKGIEASYLNTGRATATFQADSNATSILARPFFDTQTGTEAAMLVAHPDLLTGSITVEASTELQAADVLYRSRLFDRRNGHVDFVLGYRFARLDEHLRIGQSSQWTAVQGQIIPGTTKSLYDLFDTSNQFHGAELGVEFRERVGRWSLDLQAKLGVGNTNSQVLIDAVTQTTVPGGGSASFPGGLLAQETNMGRYERNNFGVLPEFGVTLGYDLTGRLRATFGYNFLYWPQVARPGEQIDLGASQLPPEAIVGAGRPEFDFSRSSFWAQGMQFGLDYRF